MKLSDPTDIEDVNRGVEGEDEFVELVRPAERSNDDDRLGPAAGGCDSLVDLEV
jgi:hypothetical protein